MSDEKTIKQPSIEEIVLASGLHQQGHATIEVTISNPTIEEIVLASCLVPDFDGVLYSKEWKEAQTINRRYLHS